MREAGKTPPDAIAELREAVDFLRYYASQIGALGDRRPRGLFACISPWNIPLAIFTGQIAATAASSNVIPAPTRRRLAETHRSCQVPLPRWKRVRARCGFDAGYDALLRIRAAMED